MAYQFQKPKESIANVPAIVAGNRLEPRTRSAEFNRSLRAEVRDAAWMLARQWQMKEFRAEDRGSPVAAAITVEYSPVNQIQVGTKPIVPYAGFLPQPLDAMVQAQPPVVDWGLHLQLGAQWTKLLRRSTSTMATAWLNATRLSYRLELPTDDPSAYDLEYALAQTTPEAVAIIEASGATALYGYTILQDIAAAKRTTNYNSFFAKTGATSASPAHQQQLLEVANKFLSWYERVYYQHDPLSQDLAAWSVEELAYQFRAAAPTQAGVAVLQAREHLGERLDWYTVDEASSTTGLGFSNPVEKIETLTSTAVPSEIQFAGAPNARWWEFEDRQVDFGQITADSSDLGRMLLQEFMFLYHNDWFSVPYTIPTGSLCTVTELTITDVFGLRYVVKPSGDNKRTESDGATQIDHDWGRWSLYALSQPGQRQISQPRLLLPPTAVGTLTGPVLEQVYLAREEATNLVWGVEQTIPDQLGRGMDGNSAAVRVTEYLRSRAQPATALPTVAKLEYKLSTPTIENWIPFVPLLSPNSASQKAFLALEQGEMLRQVEGLVLANVNDRTIKPRTSLLKYPALNYLVHEREVPPVGVRLEGNYRRARWFNGATFTWYGRSRGVGRTGGSSGLAYDQLLPREPRTEAGHFALMTAQVAGTPALLQVAEIRETDAAGTLLTSPNDTVLEVTRKQLLAMLASGDSFVMNNTQDSLQLITVNATVYVQRTSLATPPTASDKL